MSKTFTASKDTYVDIIETDGSNIATVSYTELASGATGSAPVSNGMHIAKVNTTASAIATSVQAFTDTLGNPIKQTSPVSAVGIYNPYRFNAYRSASTTYNTNAVIIFEAKAFDPSNIYSTTTGKFTAPIAGVYHLNTTVEWSINAFPNVGFGVQLSLNGATRIAADYQVNMYAGGYGPMNSCGVTLQLNAGDYVQAISVCTNSTTIGTGVSVSFNGFLVSQT